MHQSINRLIVSLLAATLVFSSIPAPAAAMLNQENQSLAFADVPTGHWAAKAILDLRSLKITDGVGNNQFGMGRTMKRSEFITYLVRLMQWELVTPETGSFADNSDPAKWFFPYIETALVHGVFFADSDFIRPEQPITREEMAMMIVGALGYHTLAGQLSSLGSPFEDVTDHTGYITIARDFGIINGVGGNRFKPDATAKREEAAAMMMRMYDRLNLAIDELHGFYAISSYSQIDFIDHLSSVSFGWSRLEFDSNKNTVVLNTTSSNRNEYAIPSGFSAPIERAKEHGVSTQLMVAVKNEVVPAAGDASGVPLSVYIIGSPDVRSQVISQIIAQVTQTSKDGMSNAFDGVVIDIEELRGSQQAMNLNAFLLELRTELNLISKKLYVAVHPKRKPGQSYFDGYDYKTIGEVADKVILMAHDYYAKKLTDTEMQNGYTVTPLSPFSEIYYALQAITDSETGVQDRSKIMLQLSFDSALWMLRDGKVINAIPGKPNYEAIRKRIQSGAEMNYSILNQNPNIRYYDSSDDTENVVWYENSQSIQAKLSLVKMFGISGISLWRLGNIPDYPDQDPDLNQNQNQDQYLGMDLDVWQQILSNLKK